MHDGKVLGGSIILRRWGKFT